MGTSPYFVRPNIQKKDSAALAEELIALAKPISCGITHESSQNTHIVWLSRCNQQGDVTESLMVYCVQEEYSRFIINGTQYYKEYFIDRVYSDDENPNSGLLLELAAEYMKQYPDALLYCEDNPFFDRQDILRIAAQPFRADWYYMERTHLRMQAEDKSRTVWRTLP